MLNVAKEITTPHQWEGPRFGEMSGYVLLVVFAVSSRNDLWLCIGPVIVAYLELTWFSALIDRLGARPAADGRRAP